MSNTTIIKFPAPVFSKPTLGCFTKEECCPADPCCEACDETLAEITDAVEDIDEVLAEITEEKCGPSV